ncbi:MAG: MBL fold metallo-hydrolase [Desulfobacterales bacterium]|nr:MBL fold metallo-hydrolase [Desulfobacterales bacterium]
MGAIDRFEYEGVEGLRTGRFNLGINTSSIVYRVGDALIDAGAPNQWPSIRSFIREKNVKRVLLTHHHEDHAGNGGAISRELNIPVLAPASGRGFLARGFPLQLYQKIVWGKPSRFETAAVPDEINAGSGLRLLALPAPGHSIDMTCYLEPDKRWLFTGDLFIARNPRYFREDEKLGATIQSLRQILSRDFNVVFCAHRGVVADGRKAIRDKLQYLCSLCDRVKASRENGLSLSEMTRKFLGREDVTSMVTSGRFSKGNLIRACLSVDKDRP